MANNFDVVIAGNALNSFGLTAFNTIAGLGLNTFGFLWPCDAIWTSCDENIVTVWGSCAIPNPPNIEQCNDEK